MTMEQSSLVEETYKTTSILNTQRLDNTNVNHLEITDIDNIDLNVDANATNLVDLHQKSIIEFEKKLRSKIDLINDYNPMGNPWKGHVDNFAKSLVKTKKRRNVNVDIHNVTTLTDRKIKTEMSINSIKTNKSNKDLKQSTSKNITKITREGN